jgi:aryl-alcohol dehydrogenase-like predicted oxidoreductase
MRRMAMIRMRRGNYLESMMQAVEASLKRLQTDFVDLYWVHILDQITPVEEVMRAKRSC